MIIDFKKLNDKPKDREAVKAFLASLPDSYDLMHGVDAFLAFYDLYDSVQGEGLELYANAFLRMDEADIVKCLSRASNDSLHVTIPGRQDCLFITAGDLYDKFCDGANDWQLMEDALYQGIWETGVEKSEYDVKEFDGPFKVGFDWNGNRYEFPVPLDTLDLVQDEDSWFHYEPAEPTEDGEEVIFEVWGTKDVFGNIRTSGPCLVKGSGNRIACLGVNVTVDGDVEEQIDDVDIL